MRLILIRAVVEVPSETNPMKQIDAIYSHAWDTMADFAKFERGKLLGLRIIDGATELLEPGHP